jgi:hypothetical protein
MSGIINNRLSGFLRSPDRDEVMQFIKRLRPYSTEHPLIRVGPNFDGGYLLPDDLVGVKSCYSPGVGGSSNFELDLAQRGIRSYMADASVHGPAASHPLFSFENKFLGTQDSGEYTTLASWVNRHTPDDNSLILQMDIEGGEYAVIDSTPEEVFSKFRIMNIEFHQLYLIWNRKNLDSINLFFDKLLKNFTVVHLHPNNCGQAYVKNGLTIPTILEITFLKNDRFKQKTPAQVFPHPLDFDNGAHVTPFPLPTEWYKD